MRRGVAERPKRMKFARQIVEIKGNSVRLVRLGGSFDDARIKGNSPHQGEFSGIAQPGERRRIGELGNVLWEIAKDLASIAEHRLAAGMAVLDIKHRVVARLLDHSGEVEIEH